VEGQWRTPYKTNYDGSRFILVSITYPLSPISHVYTLETDTHYFTRYGEPTERDYGIETKVWSSSRYGIAYNYKIGAWQDHGLASEFGYGVPDSPKIVEQTGDQVILMNSERRVLGRFTDPYYGWTPP
jgi:hypothetical protein